ncbi:MAG: PQQ-like beta-propeller repeat protein [Kiritimatiellae bacterium]|nr:PQQ-like beta-propeller repeat protein [Kiritimatiellia bacterium]
MTEAKPTAKTQRFLFYTANGVAGVTGVFAFVMSVLIIATYVQLKRVDPLNTPALLELREQFAAGSGNESLKQEIRALDLLARKAFFTAQSQIRTGSLLLFGSVVIFLAALKTIREFRKELPAPASCPGADSVWAAKGQGRKFVAAGGLLLLVFALALGFFSHTDLTPEAIRSLAGAEPPGQGDGGQGSPGVAAYAPPAREEVERYWPGFRGPHGNGVVSGRTPPLAWNTETGAGVLWRRATPKHGYSSPVVWSNRLFCTGGDEASREVYCFDTETGTLLWTAEVNGIPGAAPKLPQVDKSTGWAAPTPVTDGRHVFAIFATGNLICLDMAGQTVWGRAIGTPENHYAHSSSLIMHGNLVIVQFDDAADPRLLALEAGTGAVVWQTARKKISWASPICVENGKGAQLILADSEWVAGYDPLNGRELWAVGCFRDSSVEVGPSPAYADGMVFVCNDGAKAAGLTLTANGDGTVAAAQQWEWDESLPDTASPLAVGKYVFLASSAATIACLDAKSGKLIWEQEFKQACYASPVYAGDRVYALDLDGVMHIFKAADAYESLGEPALGEPASATPAFVGGRIYIRGDTHLYCVGVR